MALRALIELAIDVSSKLWSLARELAKTIPDPDAKTFCKDLAFELWMLQDCLEELSKPPHITKSEISKLLSDLERVCVYPNPLRASNAAGPGQLYPGLHALRKADLKSCPLTARNGLRKLACASEEKDSRHRKSLLVVLKKFSKYKAPGQSESSPDDANIIEKGESKDYTHYIRALHQALYDYRLCGTEACSLSRLVAKICLGSYLESEESEEGEESESEESVTLSLLFLPHPHEEISTLPIQWQDVQICVFRTGKVRMGLAKNRGSSALTEINSSRFCKLLNNQEQSRLCLELHDQRLTEKCYSARDTTGWVLDYPSVSLAKILSKRGLTRQMRLLLSVILSKAVWQFYDSDWMIRDWTKEDVHFMYTNAVGASTGGLYAGRPYLSMKFDDKVESDPTQGRIHKFPKILSLGVLLLEIELDITIESQRRPEHLRPDGRPNTNTDHTTASILFDEKALWRKQETFTDHKKIIGGCLGKLKPDKFVGCTNIIEERDALYKHVVGPLEKLLKRSWDDLDENPLGPMELPQFFGTRKTVAQREKIMSPVPATPESDLNMNFTQSEQLFSQGNGSIQYIENAPSLKPKSNIQTGTASSSTSPKALAALGWLKQVENMSLVLGKKRKLGGYKRVKIAILDTGFDWVHPNWIYVKDNYKDFVDEKNNDDEYKVGVDKTGHGTNGVHLLFKIMPHANICVARVFDTNEATNETPTLVAKAIKHAVENWEADIITMSLGFKDDYPEIRTEIINANTTSILFAAASNFGNTSGITFPARMRNYVICIFSSNGWGKPSPDFNPSASRKFNTNFCLLGEEVERVQYDLTRKEHESGTSIATFIAAGIAALVIDFARQKDCIEELAVRRNKLQTVEGMSAIFGKMAEEYKENGYDCVVPWAVLECPEETYSIDKKRQYIFDTIYRSLIP